MGYTTVRISESCRDTLRDLASAEGKPMQAVLEEAIETFRRKRFLEQVNAAYASLRGDAKEWAAVEQERREWEGTLLDGLLVRESRPRYGASAKGSRRRRKP